MCSQSAPSDRTRLASSAKRAKSLLNMDGATTARNGGGDDDDDNDDGERSAAMASRMLQLQLVGFVGHCVILRF